MKKKPQLSMASAFSLGMSKKNLATKVRTNARIKSEEKIAKRTKTLVDEEAAEVEREKLKQQR